MTPPPEQLARLEIDRLLTAAGWRVVDVADANVHAVRGVAVREFPLKTGYGFADYLLYVDGQAAGVIEAKPEGHTLTGVEIQSDKYTAGLPGGLPRWHNPLPFSYQSTGAETRFTNALDPEPRSRNVFAFHRPEFLAEYLGSTLNEYLGSTLKWTADEQEEYGNGSTFLEQLRHMPPLRDELWPPKPQAITNLEQSLRENRPHALVQMATGSGKTLKRAQLLKQPILSLSFVLADDARAFVV